jgi:hypothetical protein
MSTSRNRQTPIEYMGSGGNVLWEMHPSLESDEAFHRGADISMLAQFEHEEECLFPPFTMLTVMPPSQGAGARWAQVHAVAAGAPAPLPALLAPPLAHPRPPSRRALAHPRTRARPSRCSPSRCREPPACAEPHS